MIKRRLKTKTADLKNHIQIYSQNNISGRKLRAYYESFFNATDNTAQGCAIYGPQCEILFPAEEIQNVATFDGKPITYIPKKVMHEIRIFWPNDSFENIDPKKSSPPV